MIVLCRLGTMHENHRVKLTVSLNAQPDTWSHMSSLERSCFVRVRCGKRVSQWKGNVLYQLPHGLTQTNPRDDEHSELTFSLSLCPKKRTSLLHRMLKEYVKQVGYPNTQYSWHSMWTIPGWWTASAEILKCATRRHFSIP